MLGSIYIGLSGMNAFSQGLQTIGNNVSNLNSPGFKGSQVHFSDLFIRGGGGSFSNGLGGKPVGAGVRFDEPRVNYGAGELRETTGDLDLAVDGGGFMVLLGGGRPVYARTGQFIVDASGAVMLSGTSYSLAVLGAGGRPTPLDLSAKRTSLPTATQTITFTDNLSSTGTEATVGNITVFDAAGGKHTWQVKLQSAGSTAPGTWNVTVTNETNQTIATSTIRFVGGVADPARSKIVVSTPVTDTSPLSVTLDFSSGVTSFSSGTLSTLRVGKVDGAALGTLSGVTADEEGNVKITYSNGKSETLGAIALADFRDLQQLERLGSGLFVSSADAVVRVEASGGEGLGKVVARRIEASNVNLSQEFGDLILIQRGFQASSQVVSVTNDMIQELFGVRGRG